MKSNSKFALATLAGLGIAATAVVPAMAADVIYEEPPAPAPIIESAPISTWAGPYAGVHLGYGFSGEVRDRTNGNTVGTDGWLGGVFGGYNFQQGAIVYGLEADVSASGVRGSNAGTTARSQVDGSLRARAGVAVTDDILAYATAGGAVERLRVSAAGDTDTEAMFGYTVGAGVDAKLTDQVFGRVEYRYTDYGAKTFDVGGGTRVDSSNHRATVGIGFKF